MATELVADNWWSGLKRKVVRCDTKCGALNEPVTPEEIKQAFEHWQRHSNLGGCSHGC